MKRKKAESPSRIKVNKTEYEAIAAKTETVIRFEGNTDPSFDEFGDFWVAAKMAGVSGDATVSIQTDYETWPCDDLPRVRMTVTSIVEH